MFQHRRIRTHFALITTSLTLLIGILFQVMAQVETPTGSNPDTPAYALQGPYSVGRTWLVLGKGTDQAHGLVILYPALKPEGNQQAGPLAVPDEYKSDNPTPADSMGNWEFSTLNAAPDRSATPYPLVLISPGYSSTPNDYISPEEHLASYGFIVIGVFHGDTTLWAHYIARPALISRAIDLAVDLNSQEGTFQGLIDTQHIGVAGHSSGGYTALASAGAQFDMAWFENWCAGQAHLPDAKVVALSGDEKTVCSDLLAHKADMLALAGLDTMPAALWPGWGDPRITAIVSQSGDAYVFGPTGLASITIPVMVQVGLRDTVNNPEWSAFLTYDNVSSKQKAQVIFEDGDHGFFVTSMGSTRDLINHFTTAFLLDVLKGNQDAHAALAPDTVRFPGITYKAQGF